MQFERRKNGRIARKCLKRSRTTGGKFDDLVRTRCRGRNQKKDRCTPALSMKKEDRNGEDDRKKIKARRLERFANGLVRMQPVIRTGVVNRVRNRAIETGRQRDERDPEDRYKEEARIVSLAAHQ